MIVAVIVSLYASFRLGRGILQPIEALTASIRAIGEGNLNQNVPVLFADELGELAHTVNQMAGQLRTYRTSTTEKILRLNRTMQTTFSSFPDPIFVMGPDGQIELKNPAANQLAARLAMEGIRRFPPFVEEKVQQVLETRQDYFTAKLRDAISFQLDQEHFYLLRVLLLEDEKGEVFGTAIVLEDVTKLRLLDDVKSGLVATVSHELKTPLTSVRMALHVLNESTVGPLNERQAELLTTAMDDSERLLRTLNNLLDLARLEETAAALELESVPAGDLLKTAVSQTRELALANQLKLETDFPPELPSLPVDRQRINHVFTNFITNAIKHSPPGTTVLVRARLEDQFVRVSVIDQGPGVPTEHRPYVFEKFYRVPGQAKSGAGLGLAIAKEIAVAHQGHIGLKSEPGQNTEFFVDLPLQRKAEEES
jgi:signal transduction histidine kinase/HAMP domain-containing protein